MSDLPDLPQYSEQHRPRGRRYAAAALVLVLVVGLGFGAWLLLKPGPSPEAAPDPGAAARAMLRDALAAATTYYEENDTMLGFSATRAHRADPSITFDRSTTASVGQVSIRDVGPSTVVLVTSDSQGTAWCAAHSLLGDSFGKADASTAARCTGGW